MAAPITSTTSTQGTGTSTTSTTNSASTDPLLNKDAFLKLMMVQLQHQDPLQPSDPTQYLNQLAQLTTLEQTTNMASSAAASAAEQKTVAALSLLGHTVSYTDPSGNTVSGTVNKVQFTTSGPMLTVGTTSGIDPTSVDEVS